MKRIESWVLAGCMAAALCACKQVPGQGLTADQIVEKNVAARGGLDAWRKVRTMVWFGHVDSANAPVRDMPFVLAMKRPNKTRFELTVLNEKSVRVFGGRASVRWGAHGRMRSMSPGHHSSRVRDSTTVMRFLTINCLPFGPSKRSHELT